MTIRECSLIHFPKLTFNKKTIEQREDDETGGSGSTELPENNDVATKSHNEI